MKAIKKIKYKGYKIKIYYDEDVNENPNDWGDDNFLVFDHRQFYVKKDGFDPTEIFENGEKEKGYHVFRCYAYIHSGVAVSVGNNGSWPDQRWDVSFKGFWLVKRQKGAWTIKQARKIAENLCEDWNMYLSGEVYGYVIKNPEGEQIDSCWRFWGDYKTNGMIDEAKNIIDESRKFQMV